MRILSRLPLALLLFCQLTSAATLSLMPMPQKLERLPGSLSLNNGFCVTFQGYQSARLQLTAQRLTQRLQKQTGLAINCRSHKNSPAKLIIHTKNKTKLVPALSVNESYQLSVTSKKASLTADTTYGVIRGVETLLQLVSSEENSYFIPAVNILDYPRFPWRGILIDSARHFISPAAIKRQLNGMAAAKYNVFHWHLTDDQGWRIESKRFPKLHELASDGLYYSQNDIHEIVSHAHNLGIRVIPEIDMPGHAGAIAVAYPEYISAPGPYQMERSWGIHKYTLNPSDEKVYAFIDELISEISTLFPDEYIHIGGDEVEPSQWNANPSIRRFMQNNNLTDHHALQAHFNRRVEKILYKHKRKMVGWDEIFHPELPKSIVIQSWRGPDSLAHSAATGYQGILSTGYYLDQPQPAAYHYRNDPIPEHAAIDDSPSTDETWSSWSFNMPRKKGSPVTGSFTLITNDSKHRGFIDLAKKSRRKCNAIATHNGITSFWLDTWMGKTTFKVVISGNNLKGYAIVGNAQYPITGTQISGSNMPGTTPPHNKWPNKLSNNQASLVLGGEAALWSELVDDAVIDLRLWPRAFVIGERLWSNRNIRDENDMYRRMDAIEEWSVTSVGLQHKAQSNQGMLALTNGHSTQPLQILAEAIEQAQYYHRHHEKYLADNYSQLEPLNRFADTLPSESLQSRQLSNWIQKILLQPKQAKLQLPVKKLLKRWQNNHKPLMKLISKNVSLTNLQQIGGKVQQVSGIGLQCLDLLMTNKKMTQQQIKNSKAALLKAQQIDNEMVVAAAYPIENLLQACQ